MCQYDSEFSVLVHAHLQLEASRPCFFKTPIWNLFLLIHLTVRWRGSSLHGTYGDAVREVDEGVGRIVEAIREVGQEANTLVYFTSDHGGDHPQIGERGGYNGVFRGGKGNGALEGGIRVPGIVKVRLHLSHVLTNTLTSGRPELRPERQSARSRVCWTSCPPSPRWWGWRTVSLTDWTESPSSVLS